MYILCILILRWKWQQFYSLLCYSCDPVIHSEMKHCVNAPHLVSVDTLGNFKDRNDSSCGAYCYSCEQ